MVPDYKPQDGFEPHAPVVVREQAKRPDKPPPERKPRKFKVVDVMTRRTLAEDVDARGVVDVLEGVRSVVDVNVYIWDDARDDWLQLSQGDRGRLWDMRGRR